MALLRFFGRPAVELAIGLLVLVSVALTLVEFTWLAEPTDARDQLLLARIELINDLITLLFGVELSLRYLAAPSKRRFFREYWLDILAVLPLFRVFRAARVVRLLRLARLLRLFGVASRLSSHFPYIMRRGFVEFAFVCGMLALTVLFGTGAMMYFEGGRRGAKPGGESGPEAGGTSGTPRQAADASVADVDQPSPGEAAFTLERSFWFSVYSLLAGEPIPAPPDTLGGRVVAVFVMFMGLTIFAMLTGTVSAFMVDRLQSEGHSVDWEHLHGHIIVCGWNSKAEIIVREYRASHVSETPIAVIAQLDHQPQLPPDAHRQAWFLNDDFTRVTALQKAGIDRASTCIILSDMSQGRSEQDADARTILAALTVEKLNPHVYTCAELLNGDYASHLQMGHVNDYVVSGEYSAYMLAQAAMNRGLVEVITELMTYQRGNGFYRLALPAAWHGKTFQEAFETLKRRHNVILVGVQPRGGKMQVNPAQHTFAAGDDVVVISEKEVKL
ncbi:MAG: ion transporter [Pirellulaceae bacterium]|nr:ion transporter [Pirellulaceae bacterium]